MITNFYILHISVKQVFFVFLWHTLAKSIPRWDWFDHGLKVTSDLDVAWSSILGRAVFELPQGSVVPSPLSSGHGTTVSSTNISGGWGALKWIHAFSVGKMQNTCLTCCHEFLTPFNNNNSLRTFPYNAHLNIHRPACKVDVILVVDKGARQKSSKYICSCILHIILLYSA